MDPEGGLLAALSLLAVGASAQGLSAQKFVALAQRVAATHLSHTAAQEGPEGAVAGQAPREGHEQGSLGNILHNNATAGGPGFEGLLGQTPHSTLNGRGTFAILCICWISIDKLKYKSCSSVHVYLIDNRSTFSRPAPLPTLCSPCHSMKQLWCSSHAAL